MRSIVSFTFLILAAANREVHGFTLTSTRSTGTAIPKVSRFMNKDPSAYSGSSSTDGVTRRDAWERMAATAATTASGILLPNGVYAAEGTSAAAPTTTTTTVVPKVRLGDSTLETSRTIQGYWQLAGGHGRYKETDAVANMEAHFKAGITNLDTADIYGPSEIIMGKFIKSQPLAVPFTKFCCFRYLEEINKQEVKERIQKACERLQVAKLPLVQLFWSNYDIKKYVDVGLWLTELKEEGLIGEIGATNFGKDTSPSKRSSSTVM